MYPIGLPYTIDIIYYARYMVYNIYDYIYEMQGCSYMQSFTSPNIWIWIESYLNLNSYIIQNK